MTSRATKLLIKTIAITSIGLLSPLGAANSKEDINVQQQSPKAPEQTSQFGRLVGNWQIKDSFIDAKGNWQPGAGAQWRFYWILGGSAIQDDWISPAPDKPAPKAGRQYGTNIRIYNPKLNHWEMAWAANNGGKVDTFIATAKGDDVVMTGNFNGNDTQITFYAIKASQFSWKMEQKDKTTNQYKEVYRIEAKRIK